MFSRRYLCKFINKIKIPLCLYHSDPWFLVWRNSPLLFRRVYLFFLVLGTVIYYIPISLFNFLLFYKLVIHGFYCWSSPLLFRRGVSLFCFVLGNVVYYIPVSLFKMFSFFIN